MLKKIMCWPQKMLNKTRAIEFTAPLLMRLYLAPVFWMAGTNKLFNIDSTAQWFGNPDWGLGLPFPYLMAYAASLTEIIGCVCLVLGFALRWMCIPMMVVMIVAALTVHIENGWLAIADSASEGAKRLQGFMEWLKENYPQRYDYITEFGKPVILNNGIEFSATYFIMLLSLFFTGAGKYVSLDYWINKKMDCDNA